MDSAGLWEGAGGWLERGPGCPSLPALGSAGCSWPWRPRAPACAWSQAPWKGGHGLARRGGGGLARRGRRLPPLVTWPLRATDAPLGPSGHRGRPGRRGCARAVSDAVGPSPHMADMPAAHCGFGVPHREPPGWGPQGELRAPRLPPGPRWARGAAGRGRDVAGGAELAAPRRYVQFLSGLLSGTVKMNAAPLFLHVVILHGALSFDSGGGERPAWQGLGAGWSCPARQGQLCVVGKGGRRGGGRAFPQVPRAPRAASRLQCCPPTPRAARGPLAPWRLSPRLPLHPPPRGPCVPTAGPPLFQHAGPS